MPRCAITAIPEPIPYVLPHFGHTPYGRTLVGRIQVSEDIELCSFNKSEKFGLGNDDMKSFVLLRKGGCDLTKKILNA